jgi:hypothetical protein
MAIIQVIEYACCAWMMGIGLRLSLCPPLPFNDFDRVFDFGVMFILGLALFICVIHKHFWGCR